MQKLGAAVDLMRKTRSARLARPQTNEPEREIRTAPKRQAASGTSQGTALAIAPPSRAPAKLMGKPPERPGRDATLAGLHAQLGIDAVIMVPRKGYEHTGGRMKVLTAPAWYDTIRDPVGRRKYKNWFLQAEHSIEKGKWPIIAREGEFEIVSKGLRRALVLAIKRPPEHVSASQEAAPKRLAAGASFRALFLSVLLIYVAKSSHPADCCAAAAILSCMPADSSQLASSTFRF